MLVSRKIEIDMGHRVPNHKSKCKNFHGHRYVIEAGVDDKVITTKGVSDEGMVIDFGDLKEVLVNVIDERFDHGFVMYNEDEFVMEFDAFCRSGQKIIFVPFIPTVENLAKHWYELIKLRLEEKNIKIKYLKVWETPNSFAVYEED